MVYNIEDLPFNFSNIIPEMILNPHALPSRMTIGHLVEWLMNKASAIVGTYGDTTSFSHVNYTQIGNVLTRHGYSKDCTEVMYSGHTGKVLHTPLLISPTFYQRLKHMVSDKAHTRARGPVTALTRQPVEGRAKLGGLRFGEMERDCILAHGASYFLSDRLLDSSDPFIIHICGSCGLLASLTFDGSGFFCRVWSTADPSKKSSNTGKYVGSQTTQGILKVVIPFAAKALLQELTSLMILPRLAGTNNEFH